jgi:hypothetical protein
VVTKNQSELIQGQAMASAEQTGTKNPVKTGLFGSPWISLDFNLVEVAGVEPASVSSLPSALHA